MNISELQEGLYIVKNNVTGKTYLTHIVGKFPMLKVKRTVDVEKFQEGKDCEKPLDCNEIENNPEGFEFLKFQEVVLELRKTNTNKGELEQYKVFKKKREELTRLVLAGKREEAITIIASEENLSIDKSANLLALFRQAI